MNKSILFSALLVVFLVHTASAYTYINIYLDSSGNAQFFGQTNETNQTLQLPSGVSVQNGQITGITPDLTVKNKEVWTFSYYLQGAEIKVTLPDNSRIESLNKGEIFLENGKISVYFADGNSINYIVLDSSSSYGFWAILVIMLAALALLSLHYRKRITGFFRAKKLKTSKRNKTMRRSLSKARTEKGKQGEKIELLKQVLNQREKAILEKLETHERIKMSQLRKLTEIPKASFSRHVQELEKKGLVRRTGEGKNKFIELVKYDFYSG